jgi:hypothetical protein
VQLLLLLLILLQQEMHIPAVVAAFAAAMLCNAYAMLCYAMLCYVNQYGDFILDTHWLRRSYAMLM